MNQYRVTKYDPKHRTSSGIYTRGDWSSFEDIGRSFNGAELTRDEYTLAEDSYVGAAVAFLQEAGILQLTVRGLENAKGMRIRFAEGDVLTIEQLPDVLRQLLRAEFWCRLEAADAFIHVGYDFYMYLGVPRPCPSAIRQAEVGGLFVEECASPYRCGLADA